MNKTKIIIAGGGPAGLTAGIYACRSKISTLLIEKSFPGGTMLITEKIENYPGFPEGISGGDLSEKMKQQFEKFGGTIVSGDIADTSFNRNEKQLLLKNGKSLKSDVLIVATGAEKRKLGVSGEKKFLGKGVSYCAVCDGAFFKDKTVAVVGGGFSALEEALYLTRFAVKCFLIHRRDEFRASRYLQKEIFANKRIVPVLSCIVDSIQGKEKVESVLVKNVSTGVLQTLAVDGVFVSIGQIPNTEFLKGQLETGSDGHIITNGDMETSVKGIFACGDVREKNVRQVVTACGEGAIAAYFAEKYVEK